MSEQDTRFVDRGLSDEVIAKFLTEECGCSNADALVFLRDLDVRAVVSAILVERRALAPGALDYTRASAEEYHRKKFELLSRVRKLSCFDSKELDLVIVRERVHVMRSIEHELLSVTGVRLPRDVYVSSAHARFLWWSLKRGRREEERFMADRRSERWYRMRTLARFVHEILTVHGFPAGVPWPRMHAVTWEERHQFEARLRLEGVYLSRKDTLRDSTRIGYYLTVDPSARVRSRMSRVAAIAYVNAAADARLHEKKAERARLDALADELLESLAKFDM